MDEESYTEILQKIISDNPEIDPQVIETTLNEAIKLLTYRGHIKSIKGDV